MVNVFPAPFYLQLLAIFSEPNDLVDIAKSPLVSTKPEGNSADISVSEHAPYLRPPVDYASDDIGS